jgi:hypothetical protein
MRVFVSYDEQGTIVTVLRIEELPEGIQSPINPLPPGHSIFELPENAKERKLEPAKIAADFKVNVKRGELTKKTAAERKADKQALEEVKRTFKEPS